jgi:hypothetical protein
MRQDFDEGEGGAALELHPPANHPPTRHQKMYPSESRRPRRATIATLLVVMMALVAMDGWIMAKRKRYQGEIARLRASMTDLERRRTDEIVAQDEGRLRVAIALIRRQARMEGSLHLSVSVDSSAMYLEREGALLREMPVHVGPERRVEIAADTVRLVPPRGVRTIARLLGASDAWEVPEWVYADRGLAIPPQRSIVGSLGTVAILLEGGTILYSMPVAGPLNDSAYVLPGAVRARTEDLQAILPSLSAGMRVYFY